MRLGEKTKGAFHRILGYICDRGGGEGSNVHCYVTMEGGRGLMVPCDVVTM